MSDWVSVCVCAIERERERERRKGKGREGEREGGNHFCFVFIDARPGWIHVCAQMPLLCAGSRGVHSSVASWKHSPLGCKQAQGEIFYV